MGRHSAPKQASKISQAADKVSLYKGLAFALPAGAAVAGMVAPGVAQASTTDAHTLQVTDPAPQVQTAVLAAFKLKVHHGDKVAIVERGDTLSGIAETDCHKAAAWPALYRASRKRGWLGPDPDLIFSGDHVDLACKGSTKPVATADVKPLPTTHVKPSIGDDIAPPVVHHTKHHAAIHVSGICGTRASGMLPANYNTIFQYLRGRGLSASAASGVLGNIWQESQGNPESVGSGGGGLIGWTPLGSAHPVADIVTGSCSRDLAVQMEDVVQYIETNGSIGNMNAYSSPASAAEHFMAQYERCLPSACAPGNRELAAEAVARAEGF